MADEREKLNVGSAESRRSADQRAEQRAESRRRVADNKRADLEKQQQDREAQVVRNDQVASQSQPTPTQLENDLAKQGVAVDDKEDDGSGPDRPRMRSIHSENDDPRYKTRNMGSSSQPQARPAASAGDKGSASDKK
jgi:hypothetical protein